DVLNLIPPQRAGAIAVQADLVGADKRWCEVDHVTYESVKQKDIHVVGDATIGLPVPKSGNVANAMGKAAALAIGSLLNGQPVPLMPPGNTCYSWVSDKEAIAVVNAYKIENSKVVQIEQKLTPAQSVSVAQRAEGWRQSIWADALCKMTMTSVPSVPALVLALLSILAGFASAHAAGPLDSPGFVKVITCSACHGQN